MRRIQSVYSEKGRKGRSQEVSPEKITGGLLGYSTKSSEKWLDFPENTSYHHVPMERANEPRRLICNATYSRDDLVVHLQEVFPNLTEEGILKKIPELRERDEGMTYRLNYWRNQIVLLIRGKQGLLCARQIIIQEDDEGKFTFATLDITGVFQSAQSRRRTRTYPGGGQ